MNGRKKVTGPANALRAEIDQLRAEMNQGFASLEKQLVDGHSAILAAIKQLPPR